MHIVEHEKNLLVNDYYDNEKNVWFLHARINCHCEYILLHKTDMKTVQENGHNNGFSGESPFFHTGYIDVSHHFQPHAQKYQSCSMI
jgi:hypothetical protein